MSAEAQESRERRLDDALEKALTALNMIADNHQGDSWSAGVAVSALDSIEDDSARLDRCT